MFSGSHKVLNKIFNILQYLLMTEIALEGTPLGTLLY